MDIIFLSDEGPTLETLDFTIRIDSAPTFFYFGQCYPTHPSADNIGLVLYKFFISFSIPSNNRLSLDIKYRS